MKRKIVGIFICTLLFATTFIPLTEAFEEETIPSAKAIELIPVVDFILVNGGFFSISVLIKNSGDGTAHDIYWEMNVTGGFFFYPRFKNGEIDELGKDQVDMIKIRPALGFGKVNIYLYCKYKVENYSRCELEVEVKDEWIDLALGPMHLFPGALQPEKKWEKIEQAVYKESPPDKFVELKYKQLNKMHKVRVLNYNTMDTEFLGACCFENGLGNLKECWVTKDIVTSEEAYWEVETVDNQ